LCLQASFGDARLQRTTTPTAAAIAACLEVSARCCVWVSSTSKWGRASKLFKPCFNSREPPTSLLLSQQLGRPLPTPTFTRRVRHSHRQQPFSHLGPCTAFSGSKQQGTRCCHSQSFGGCKNAALFLYVSCSLDRGTATGRASRARVRAATSPCFDTRTQTGFTLGTGYVPRRPCQFHCIPVAQPSVALHALATVRISKCP
jgi:hypothetical protein